ncbi:MAG: DedA family protein [Candidatus Rokubacteria bacterium]|nr:DedA family protein [Candidatus Rokubacteria bacterium]
MQAFLEHFTYVGIFAVLFAAGLGVPVPEEAPVLAAGVLSSVGTTRWWIALPVCIGGVLSGDVVLYWVGHHWGERVLNWRIVRRLLSPDREERFKNAYRRHAAKTIFAARHVMGVRAAAFLTAGIARVPFWKFLLVDGIAAIISVPVGFGLAYFFTDQLEQVITDVKRIERWIGLGASVIVAALLAFAAWRRSKQEIRREMAGEP